LRILLDENKNSSELAERITWKIYRKSENSP